MTDDTTTRFSWDVAAGAPQVLVTAESTSPESTNPESPVLHLPGIGSWNGESWTYYLPDALGSVRQLADERGHVVQTYDYTPFGRILAVDGVRVNAQQYAGEHQRRE